MVVSKQECDYRRFSPASSNRLLKDSLKVRARDLECGDLSPLLTGTKKPQWQGLARQGESGDLSPHSKRNDLSVSFCYSAQACGYRAF